MKPLYTIQWIVLFPVLCAQLGYVADVSADGNYRRGRALFAQRACASCHTVDGKKESVGPDLSKPENAEQPLTRAELLEAITEPSKKIRKGFESYSAFTTAGKVVTGRLVSRTDGVVKLLVPEAGGIREATIDDEDIDELVKLNVSVMPKDLLKGLRESQVNDLLAYVETVTDPDFHEAPAATIPEKLPGIGREPEASDATVYSPEESMKRIHLAPGYRLELVAAEPMIEEPVMCVWDGNGRMYVAEMRTYMQDADGTGEDLPKSRVSMLEDTNGDGRMDKVTRFVDNLVLPRMILPLDDRILINETYTEDYYSYRDTDGDGVADEKILIYPGGKAGGNLEHQNSGITWGIDNWIYTARTGAKRHRFINNEWTSESIYGDNGQWGLAMNDVGRLFLSTAGGERPAYGFQQLPHYGKLQLPGEREPDFEAVFPIVKMVDVQGGLGRVGPRGGLNRFTGCAGQSIYRGDRLPADFHGDYILPEPVGRLVRRAKVTSIDGKYVMSNAYRDSEFIASTDKNFRPLWSATGPDGCLYIVDMYRGIIQEGNWTRKGSYLRDVIDKEGFARNIGRGRIYRVVHESTVRDASPRLLERESTELVAHLSHPNGWRRDSAQKLLVLRGGQSVLPELEALALEGDAPLGRMHALWTLDGLGLTKKEILVAALRDDDPRVRLAAIRISESRLADDAALTRQVADAGFDENMDVVVQAINALRFADSEDARKQIMEIASAYPFNDLVMASTQSSLRYRQGGGGPSFANVDPKTLEQMKQGFQTFTMLCIRCHGPDGKGAISSDGLQLAPSLVGSARLLASPELPARILLHGLSGPIEGKKYPGAMESMKRQDDKWIASTLTYVRNSFGNSAPAVTAKEVARVRRVTRDRTTPYTLEDFAAYVPLPRETLQSWAYASSTEGAALSNAVDGDPETRFDTKGFQKPGQWFQFDMGETYEVTSVVLDATGSNNDYPRGYVVRISDDGQTWSEPIASGKGIRSVTNIGLPPATFTRHLRITQTGSHGLYWSIHELTVHGRQIPRMVVAPRNPAVDRTDDEVSLEFATADVGRVLYSEHCRRCHGRSGMGRVDADERPLAVPINDRSNVVRNAAALLRVTLGGLATKDPDRACPGLTDGSDETIASLASYVRREFNTGLAKIEPAHVKYARAAIRHETTPFRRKALVQFLPIRNSEMQSWSLTASHGQKEVRNAIDGNPNSRYSTGTSMKPGMWFAFDMRHVHALNSILLDTRKSKGDFPRGYSVYVSRDGQEWSGPIVTGEATTPVTEILLPVGTMTRHVKIEQTGQHGLFWSIHELHVFGLLLP